MPGVFLTGETETRQKRIGDRGSFWDIQERGFRDEDERGGGKTVLHLQAKAFKIAVPVRETCAADDQIAFFRKIHQRFVLHTTIGFGHPQF